MINTSFRTEPWTLTARKELDAAWDTFNFVFKREYQLCVYGDGTLQMPMLFIQQDGIVVYNHILDLLRSRP